ncbi:MAG: hypothetical protein AAF787_18370 [Chloroflexota bacterium]
MAVGILFTFRDGKAATSSTQVNLPSSTAIADAVLFGQQMALLIDPLVNGFISRIGIVVDVDLSALAIANAPSPLADVEEGARFQFRTAQNNFTSMRIPTFIDNLITAGGNAVDQVNVDVAAYLTAMETGIDLTGVGGSGTISPSDTRDEDITATTSALESFQSSRG